MFIWNLLQVSSLGQFELDVPDWVVRCGLALPLVGMSVRPSDAPSPIVDASLLGWPVGPSGGCSLIHDPDLSACMVAC